MKMTFDSAKDLLNQEKHGHSLADAQLLDWEDALIWPDNRLDYGEPRMAALAPMGDRIYDVAFVDRALTRRVISLRKANTPEVNRYATNH